MPVDFTEIKTIIETQNKAFEAFKQRHDAVLEEHAMKIAGLSLGPQQPANDNVPSTRNTTPAFQAMHRFMRSGARSELTGSAPADGGYTVPKEVDGTIRDQLVSISPMRSIARVVGTTSRDYHTLVGARGTTSGWAGEEDPRNETDSPKMADIVPPSGEVYACPSATNWVLEDSQFDLEAWLRDNVATELAHQEGAAFISGDGVKKPKGILTYNSEEDHELGPIATVNSGSSTALTSDGLIDLVYDLTAPYRAGAAFLMNSKTAGAARKLKDGNGNYIWQPGLTLGQPDTILGYRVVIDENMPDIAANSTPVVYGNFNRGYLITDTGAFTVIRDQVTKKGWTRLYFSRRVGGAVTDPAALRLYKVAA